MKNQRFFTIPNILTLIRIALIPIIVFVFFKLYDQYPYLPATIYIFAAVTDLADGYIAKRFNMVSDYGKVLDPLADKLFLNTMLLCFFIKNPNLIVALLLCINATKELYLIIAGSMLYKRKFIMPSKFIGKAASFVFNCGVALYFFMIYEPAIKAVSETLMFIGLLLSLSAAVYYTVIVYRETGGKLPPKDGK